MTSLALATQVLLLLLTPLAALLLRAIPDPDSRWRVTGSALAALLILIAMTSVEAFYGTPSLPGLRIDLLSLALLWLIGLIGAVIARYAHTYLQGDRSAAEFPFWLLLTLSAVIVTVTADHLLLLWAGWVATNLALQPLLLCYPERRAAQTAARKRALASRLSELALLGGCYLLWRETGQWQISALLATADLTLAMHGALLLIAGAALIQCAQLPLHGWLMQVMEAPTPVSALLHAGIINLGGYLVIRFAPLISHSEPAIWLLLVVAGASALLASLCMMSRVSIKVMLAWSSCAQMGFMLIECALGFYHLALLHLLAHSFYKAHAFLSSGSRVHDALIDQLRGAHRLSARHWLGAMGITAALLAVLMLLPNTALTDARRDLALLAIIACASVLLFAEMLGARHLRTRLQLACAGGAVIALYGGWHLLLSGLLGGATLPDISMAQLMVSALIFAALLAGHILLRQRANHTLQNRLRRQLFHGFHLDEWSTRLTLCLLPLRRTPSPLTNDRRELV